MRDQLTKLSSAIREARHLVFTALNESSGQTGHGEVTRNLVALNLSLMVSDTLLNAAIYQEAIYVRANPQPNTEKAGASD